MAAPGPHGLFGDDGALTRNTITENGVTKKGRGVTCKACGESTVVLGGLTDRVLGLVLGGVTDRVRSIRWIAVGLLGSLRWVNG